MKKTVIMVIALLMLFAGASVAQAGDVTSKFDISIYGYIKVDTVYQDAKAVQDNFLVFVPPGNLHDGFLPEDEEYDSNDEDPSFSVTARQSRFGLKIKGPEFGNGAVTKGRLEMDFYGVGGGKTIYDPKGNPYNYEEENKGNLMLRIATIELAFPTWSILAGNDWMIMSPIFPHVNNYTYAAEMGNLGYRMPQVRFTKYFMDKKLAMMASYGEKIGEYAGFMDIDTGDDAAFPDIQYGIVYSDDMWGGKLNVGYTGHYSEEELQNDDSDHVISFSNNIHFIIPLGEKFGLSGEYFWGGNLDGWYCGGVGQGWVYDEDGDPEPLLDQGGWIELMVKPISEVTLYFGYGVDDVDDDQLEDGIQYGGGGSMTGITKNSMGYINANYHINPATTLALEWMNAVTEYEIYDGDDGYPDWDDGVVNRYTMSLWYFF